MHSISAASLGAEKAHAPQVSADYQLRLIFLLTYHYNVSCVSNKREQPLWEQTDFFIFFNYCWKRVIPGYQASKTQLSQQEALIFST